MDRKMQIQVVFDKDENLKKWRKRFHNLETKMKDKLEDPIIGVYLDAIEETIKNTPATSGETKAGWAKPLDVEGRSLAAVVTPEMNIRSTKYVEPDKSTLEKGLEKSIYRKEIEDKSINLETINGTKGAVYTEYGDSRTPPTAAVRQAAMKLVDDAERVVGTTLKEVSK